MSGARRGLLVLSGIALAVGVGGLLAARDLPFTAARGEILLGLGVSFNPLGALITIVLAAAAIWGALVAGRGLVLAAAGGFALAALQVLLQFGRATNWLGSRGSNLSFWLALAVGLLSLVWLQLQEAKSR